MKKSRFSCSLKPPEIKISGKHKNVLGFQNIESILNIAFPWETKAHMEKSFFIVFLFLNKIQ